MAIFEEITDDICRGYSQRMRCGQVGLPHIQSEKLTNIARRDHLGTVRDRM